MTVHLFLEKDFFNTDQINALKMNNHHCVFCSPDDLSSLNSLDEKIIAYDPDYAGWEFNTKILNAKNIKAICLATTTESYINKELCDSKNIKVLSIPKYSTDSVAEYMVFLMFCLAKKLPLQMQNDFKQDFLPELTQLQLRGKKVGIIGFGNIGSRFAEITHGIGMEVCYWNRTVKKAKYQYSELKNIFSRCDVILVTLSTNSETQKVITDDLLMLMTEKTILLSVGGDKLFNHKLVVQMAEQKKIFGYGLEIPNKSPMNYKGNIMVTSEFGWFTKESQDARVEGLFKNLTIAKLK